MLGASSKSPFLIAVTADDHEVAFHSFPDGEIGTSHYYVILMLF